MQAGHLNSVKIPDKANTMTIENHEYFHGRKRQVFWYSAPKHINVY